MPSLPAGRQQEGYGMHCYRCKRCNPSAVCEAQLRSEVHGGLSAASL